MINTLDYYNQNADDFIQGTISVDFAATQDKFINKLEPGALILDFGCGSGRDTKYFLDRGFFVEATDGSEELCKRASEYTGITVKQMLFQELDAKEKYAGIWACSSILHLPKDELKVVLGKMADAVMGQGVIYTSFKYSEFEGERNGRYFTDFTLETFTEYISDIDSLKIEEYWITGEYKPPFTITKEMLFVRIYRRAKVESVLLLPEEGIGIRGMIYLKAAFRKLLSTITCDIYFATSLANFVSTKS